MRVFVTGATGWIGTATVAELLAAGHRVDGLARSDASAARLAATGAGVVRGDLDTPEVIAAAAGAADGVVHLANKHDWANPAASDAAERLAVEAIGTALAGSDRVFVLANGLAGIATGRPATEADPSPFVGPAAPRGGSENRALDFVGQGVRVVPVRFAPTVHGPGDSGFVAGLVAVARRNGVSGYPGDGGTAWSAVARADAAHLVRLAVEQAPAGARLHAVDEPAIRSRQIAEGIGAMLDLPVASVPPERTAEHFGFLGRFFALDISADSARTRELTGWVPTGPGLLDDLAAGAYR